MRNLASLLQKFSNLLDKKSVVKEAVSQVIKNHTKGSVPTDNIFVEGSVLEIHSSPVIKNEIRLKESLILEELKQAHNLHISRILYK